MRGILISPSESERSQFEAAARTHHHHLSVTKVLDDYPDEATLARIIRAWAPEVVFLSMADPIAAEVLSQLITREFQGIQQVAIHHSQDPEVFRQVLHLRMMELLCSPFESSEFLAMLARRSAALASHPVKIGTTDRFFAFLPAKSGVGTSTIAANLTWALGKMPDTRALLMDFDLFSGVSGFLFNATNDYSVTDAINRKHELDEDSWQRLVTRKGKVDLLLSGAPRLPEQIQHNNIPNLIEFARRNYSVISADLPDAFDDLSLSVLRDANRIFLTTTPELPALRLAKLKVLTLRKLDLENKAVLLLNRFSRRSELSVEQIENTVGLPVFATFGCEYEDVMKAAREARPSAKLAHSFDAFAAKLMDSKAVEPKRHRFIERFAVVPVRYGFR